MKERTAKAGGGERRKEGYRVDICSVFYIEQLFPKLIADERFDQFQRSLYPKGLYSDKS